MTDSRTPGWFAEIDVDDPGTAAAAVRDGRADEPRDWPALAVEAGVVADQDEYYDALHEATLRATRRAVQERERADDQQLIHCVRAMDDMARILV